jgi:hypothetical protein
MECKADDQYRYVDCVRIDYKVRDHLDDQQRMNSSEQRNVFHMYSQILMHLERSNQ